MRIDDSGRADPSTTLVLCRPAEARRPPPQPPPPPPPPAGDRRRAAAAGRHARRLRRPSPRLADAHPARPSRACGDAFNAHDAQKMAQRTSPTTPPSTTYGERRDAQQAAT